MAVQSITSPASFFPYRKGNTESTQYNNAAARTEAPRTAVNLPVERVVEGEVLERGGRAAGASGGDFLERFLSAGRMGGGESAVPSSAAIGAYMSNRNLGDGFSRQPDSRIDFYV